MPHFIEQHGDPQIPPPYTFPNVTIHSFRLEADIRVLTELCNARLNIGTREKRGFEYRPILPYVDLEVLHYPRMFSANPRFNWGWLTQRECYFRLIVGRYDFRAGGLVPAEAAVFIPYIFVDNAWSLISGREVVGFPKVMASIATPNSETVETGRLYPIRVSTDVFEQYSAKSNQCACRILEIKNSEVPGMDDVPAETIWPWGVLPKRMDPAWLPFLRDRNGFAIVQLKQIRDAEQSQIACYQALIHAEFSIGRIEPVKTLPSADIDIWRYDSLRIDQELGLMGEPLRPLWQYAVTCDLKYGNVRNLFVNA